MTYPNAVVMENELKQAIKDGLWAAVIITSRLSYGLRAESLQVFSRTAEADSDCFVRGKF
jgi:hypothetical protein